LKKKIVLLGDSAVGKTSLIRRYVFDQFEDSYITTIGTKVTAKQLEIPREGSIVKMKLLIWDLIGRAGYHALHASSFVGVHGAILVTDMTRRETMESLERYWIPSLFHVVEKVPMLFTCNKSDLKRKYEFKLEDLVDMASRFNGGLEPIWDEGLEPSYPTSAKDGSNVEKAFETIGHMVLSSKELTDPIRELYESLVAMRIKRNTDKTTPIGALDAIIMDFSEGFEDSNLAMMILRQEVVRAGVDVRTPTREGILRTVEYLAEAEHDHLDEKIVISNLERRYELASRVKE
jgi:small GTP-binding protein